MPRLLLSPIEAAEMLQIGQTKLYELMGSGELESVHIGRCRRVPMDAIETYVAELRKRAEAESWR